MPLALRRQKTPELTLLRPADVQQAAQAWPERSGLVELVGAGGPDRELSRALATVLSRHADRLWGGLLDTARFPKLVQDFLAERGMSREEFDAALPAVGLIRHGRLFAVLAPALVFPAGRARLRALTEQVDAFAVKFAVAYTPKPPEPAAAPPAQVNRDRPVPVKITRGGQTHEVTLYEGENLLDGALERGVQLEYSCKQGKCDTCTVTVLQGRENLSEPTEGERQVLGELLEQGRRLACQVTVKGPVEIRQ